MRRYWSLAIYICVPWLAWSARSEAQVSTADKAAAEVLFERGRQLNRDGRYAEACSRFEQSQAVESSLGTLLYLADCYEKLGRSASAWALFLEASSQAAASGQMERAQAGKRRAELLEPNLSKLSVLVPAESDVSGLEILRNGTSVGHALWGVPIPVDPGDYVIEARAPNRAPWSTLVHLESGAARAVATVPRLTEAPAQASSAAAEAAPSQPSTRELMPNRESSLTPTAASGGFAAADRPASALKVLGVTAAAVGAASLIVGGIFGLRAIAKNNDAKAFCASGGGPVCSDQAGVVLSREANNAAKLTNLFMIGGAGLLVGGAVLFFAAPAGSEHAAVGVAFGPGRADLQVGGVF